MRSARARPCGKRADEIDPKPSGMGDLEFAIRADHVGSIGCLSLAPKRCRAETVNGGDNRERDPRRDYEANAGGRRLTSGLREFAPPFGPANFEGCTSGIHDGSLFIGI
jgi:hypothetical protein